MESTDKASLTIVQMNDTHAYFDLHQEMFWQGDHAVYNQAGGYAHIATIVKQIWTESQGNCLFCDCGDTFHGTYPAIDTQGKAMIPILKSGKDGKGGKVKNRKQAIAIGISEAKEAGLKVPDQKDEK